MTTPTAPLIRDGPSPAVSPEPMHLLCYNSGAATFPSCPGANTAGPPPPPPPYHSVVDVCSSTNCLQSGWPSLYYGRVCYFSSRFAYPMTCALWAATFGAREVAERKVPYGGAGWDTSWISDEARVEMAAEASAAAGTEATREPANDKTTAHADGGARQSTGASHTAGTPGQDLDAESRALLEALAPVDVWVKNGVFQAKRS